jgi:RNA polymerase sigma factor (sigma-70 family)
MLTSDSEIVQLMLAEGSQNTGLRHLMNKYQERLYWVIKNILENHEDTDDVLQNTFVKAYRYIHRFESRSSLFTWLYRIATNEALTFKRNAKKMNLISVDPMAMPLHHNQTQIPNREEEIVASLEKAIASLPERQREVFKMRYYQEMSYEEMGSLLGLTEGALKASYHHAVKKLEQYLIETTTY